MSPSGDESPECSPSPSTDERSVPDIDERDGSNPNAGGPGAIDPPSSQPTGSDRSNQTRDIPESATIGERIRRRWSSNHGPVMVVREIAISVIVVMLIGALLFGISGVWPPMVAVESGSMEPHMYKGDLVFIADNQRFVHDAAVGNTGIVPADQALAFDYQKFGDYGDVIVFKPDGDIAQTPIIHRAHLWVEEGENWYERADPDFIGQATNCNELRNCPASQAGFITRGDNNAGYDQVQGQSGPVKPEWIIARSHVRLPWLGWIRLYVSDLTPTVVIDVSVSQEKISVSPEELMARADGNVRV